MGINWRNTRWVKSMSLDWAWGKTKKKALFWYEKSAAQHHVPAMDKVLALTGISSTAPQPAPRALVANPAVDSQVETAYQDMIKSWEAKYNDLLAKMKIVSKANASLNERADADKIKIEKLTHDKKVLNKTIDQLDENITSVKHKKNDEIKKLQRKVAFLEEDLDDLEDKLRPHKKTRSS